MRKKSSGMNSSFVGANNGDNYLNESSSLNIANNPYNSSVVPAAGERGRHYDSTNRKIALRNAGSNIFA